MRRRQSTRSVTHSREDKYPLKAKLAHLSEESNCAVSCQLEIDRVRHNIPGKQRLQRASIRTPRYLDLKESKSAAYRSDEDDKGDGDGDDGDNDDDDDDDGGGGGDDDDGDADAQKEDRSAAQDRSSCTTGLSKPESEFECLSSPEERRRRRLLTYYQPHKTP